MSHLPIGSNSGGVYRMFLVHMTFFSALRMFCDMSVSRGLKPPFRWVQMAVHCSRGVHIGVHRLIFSGFIEIFPIVTVVSLSRE